MCAQDTHSERSRVAGGRGSEGTGKTEEKALQSERGDSGLGERLRPGQGPREGEVQRGGDLGLSKLGMVSTHGIG